MNRIMRWLRFSQVVLYEDMLVLWGDGVLPPIPNVELLRRYSNTRVSTVFITEDDLDDPRVIEEKVACFLNDYGMRADKIKVVVMIARNPSCKWGRGFPYKIRISAFPRSGYELFDKK